MSRNGLWKEGFVPWSVPFYLLSARRNRFRGKFFLQKVCYSVAVDDLLCYLSLQLRLQFFDLVFKFEILILKLKYGPF